MFEVSVDRETLIVNTGISLANEQANKSIVVLGWGTDLAALLIDLYSDLSNLYFKNWVMVTIMIKVSF